MGIVSRWTSRLKTRRKLERSARQRYIWHPTPENLKLLVKRRRQVAEANRVIARHQGDTGADAAIRWALSQVGVTEKPRDSNWGVPVQDWIKASGYTYPVPYCQCGANAAAVHGGCPQLRTGYTPTVLAGLGGYKRIPLVLARPGDFIYFDWPGIGGSAPCDHVGVLLELTATTVKCVEFNTSPSNAGSQNNGGGVYIRTRSRGLVAGAVHPPYPS